MVQKYEAQVHELEMEMKDEENKRTEKEILERQIREEINAQAAQLFDQKVKEVRMEYENRFNTELQKREQLMFTDPLQQMNHQQLYQKYMSPDENLLKAQQIMKSLKIPTSFPNTITTKHSDDESDEPAYDRTMNE